MRSAIRVTSSSSVRRSLSSLTTPHPELPIQIPLDLAKPAERATYDFVRRMSTGRWPSWGILGVRREGKTLYFALEWLRYTDGKYALMEMAVNKIAVCWTPQKTAAAALTALGRVGNVRGIGRASAIVPRRSAVAQ